MSGAQIGRVFIAVLAMVLTTSCGQPRERKTLSRNSAQLKFAGGTAPETAAIQPQDQYTITRLLGTYDGSIRFNYGAPQGMSFELGTEQVELEEDGKVYTFAKIRVNAPGVSLESYLATQQGTVSGYPALAFSSVTLSHPLISPQEFAIYLVLSQANGQFLPAQSSIYLMDCGLTRGGPCASNKLVSTTTFGTELRKRL